MMKRFGIGVLLVTIMGLGLAFAQTPSNDSIAKLDPALDGIVPANARIEILIDDYFGHSEGPVWIDDGQSGYLLFSDFPANRVYKWAPNRELSVFLEPSGYSGDPAKAAEAALITNNGRMYVALVGSNGLTVDRDGRLIMCASGDRAIVRMEKNGTRTTLADRYEGKRLNRPNDLVMKSDGSVYFSSPSSNPPPDSAPVGVYRWHNGAVQLIIKDFQGGTPNGVAFSPDEKHFYTVIGGKIWRYTVQPDGTVTDGRIFVDQTGADGLKLDRTGNLYFGGPGGLWIVSSEGKHLGTIPSPRRVVNMAFGEVDRKTLYIIVQRGLARLRLNVAGI